MPVGSPRSSLVEKLPSVQITVGWISSTWRSRYSWQFSISTGCGSRLPGGRHLSTLAMNTSARAQPDLPEQLAPAACRRARRTAPPARPRWRRAPRRRTSARRRRCRRRTRPSCASRPARGSARSARACASTCFSASRRSAADRSRSSAAIARMLIAVARERTRSARPRWSPRERPCEPPSSDDPRDGLGRRASPSPRRSPGSSSRSPHARERTRRRGQRRWWCSRR